MMTPFLPSNHCTTVKHVGTKAVNMWRSDFHQQTYMEEERIYRVKR